jgi:hypothetical protein
VGFRETEVPRMADTRWSDVSEYQVRVTDRYPYQVLCIRSNDGTYRDKKFASNYEWARRALDSGRLKALIIYIVYRPNWQQTLDTTRSMVGVPHPHTAFMIDVESWEGQITGDNSDRINRLYWGLADWIGSPARVIGYGNVRDLNTLWPAKPAGVRLIVAAYGSNPSYPGKLGHQFTNGIIDALEVPPFGRADVNSADGYDIDTFCAAIGIGRKHITAAPGEDMAWRLERTPLPAGNRLGDNPSESWPTTEDIVALPGPAGGWRGRILTYPVFGFGGAWIQEAWWGPAGGPIVPRDKGLAAGQFQSLIWEAPESSRFLVIRYAAPAGGSIGIETEH